MEYCWDRPCSNRPEIVRIGTISEWIFIVKVAENTNLVWYLSTISLDFQSEVVFLLDDICRRQCENSPRCWVPGETPLRVPKPSASVAFQLHRVYASVELPRKVYAMLNSQYALVKFHTKCWVTGINSTRRLNSFHPLNVLKSDNFLCYCQLMFL